MSNTKELTILPGKSLIDKATECTTVDEVLRVIESQPVKSQPMILEQTEVRPLITMRQLQKEYFLHVLNVTNGNKTETAKILDVTIKTVYNWIEEFK